MNHLEGILAMMVTWVVKRWDCYWNFNTENGINCLQQKFPNNNFPIPLSIFLIFVSEVTLKNQLFLKWKLMIEFCG